MSPVWNRTGFLFRMSHRSSLMQIVMTIMQWRIWVKVTVTDIGREWMENWSFSGWTGMLCIMIIFGPILRSKTLASMITGLTIRLMQNIPKKSRTLMEKSFLIILLLFWKPCIFMKMGRKSNVSHWIISNCGSWDAACLLRSSLQSWSMIKAVVIQCHIMTTWMTIRRRRPKQWINSDIITDGPVIPIL